jgi:GT2 family glycosyltransferase
LVGSVLIGCVVVYFRAGSDVLTETLDALRRSTHALAHVVVVDNASGDGVVQAVAAQFGVRSLLREVNDGYAAGVLAGAEELPAEVSGVLVLTHECRIDGEGVAALAGALAPDVGVAAPRLVRPDGEVWSDGGRDGSAFRRPFHEVVGSPYGVRDVAWVDGAAFLIRRELLSCLPTAYGLYFEDVELGWAVRRAGHRVVVCGATSAVQNTRGMPPFWLARGWVLYGRRTSRKALSFGATSMIVLMAARDLLRGAIGSARQLLRGVREGWRTSLAAGGGALRLPRSDS